MSENVGYKVKQDDISQFHNLSPQAAVELLKSDVDKGLSEDEVLRRKGLYGDNLLNVQKPPSPFTIFISQFKDFMIYVLLVAVAISIIEGQVVEALAILSILILNGILGFVQEYRAEKALESLKELSSPVSTVIRGGVEKDIPSKDLVPGDIVILEAGDGVPADGRIISEASLEVVESSLTGESNAIKKDADAIIEKDIGIGDKFNMVFAGTDVSIGRGKMLVTSIGVSSEIGKIAKLLADTQDQETPLQKELKKAGKIISILVLIIAGIVLFQEMFVIFKEAGWDFSSLVSQKDFRGKLTEALLVAISLAVAAIPEGLPAVVTLALSMGVKKMTESNAIIRKLHAVETLGSTSFICSDKTGTITKNQMTVTDLLIGRDIYGIGDLVFDDLSENQTNLITMMADIMGSNNDARVADNELMIGDPTETALLDFALQKVPDFSKRHRIHEIPFDSNRKTMTTVHKKDEEIIAFVKGGVDVLMDKCSSYWDGTGIISLDDGLRKDILGKNLQLAEKGIRTLLLAYRVLDRDLVIGKDDLDSSVIERDLVYVGIVGMTDPPRDEVSVAIQQCHDAGIQVAMITGDHAVTAKSIAEQIGLNTEYGVVSGHELEEMDYQELLESTKDSRVFARVSPEHKINIVSALIDKGHVVAMTGDGVNDAPALKKADIGVAMGKVGTDVSREASDMVLADDNFATIVKAIYQGRVVYDNLRKVITFLLSCNISEVLIVFISALISSHVPLLPLQILWINLITDGLPALALGVDPADEGIMKRPPRDKSKGLLSKDKMLEILLNGSVISFVVLFIYFVIEPLMSGGTPQSAKSVLFTAIILIQMIFVLSLRSGEHSFFSSHIFKNKWLLGSIGLSLGLHVLVLNLPFTQRLFQIQPIHISEWFLLLGMALFTALIFDVIKILRRKFDKTV